MKKSNTNTTNKKATEKTTADYIKEIEKENIVSYNVFNSNKALKTGLKIVFNNFEIKNATDDDFNFDISCKIKTNDFKKLYTNEMFDISNILKMQLNLFDNVYKSKFLTILTSLDEQTKKLLLSKSICYCLKLSNGLQNTIKYYKDNNLTPTTTDLMTKQKLSIYQVLKQYVFTVYSYLNSANK